MGDGVGLGWDREKLLLLATQLVDSPKKTRSTHDYVFILLFYFGQLLLSCVCE